MEGREVEGIDDGEEDRGGELCVPLIVASIRWTVEIYSRVIQGSGKGREWFCCRNLYLPGNLSSNYLQWVYFMILWLRLPNDKSL